MLPAVFGKVAKYCRQQCAIAAMRRRQQWPLLALASAPASAQSSASAAARGIAATRSITNVGKSSSALARPLAAILVAFRCPLKRERSDPPFFDQRFEFTTTFFCTAACCSHTNKIRPPSFPPSHPPFEMWLPVPFITPGRRTPLHSHTTMTRLALVSGAALVASCSAFAPVPCECTPRLAREREQPPVLRSAASRGITNLPRGLLRRHASADAFWRAAMRAGAAPALRVNAASSLRMSTYEVRSAPPRVRCVHGAHIFVGRIATSDVVAHRTAPHHTSARPLP